MKKILALDMDQIITRFSFHAIKQYNKHHGTDLDPHQADQFIGPHTSNHPDISQDKLESLFRKPGFFLDLQPIPGAVSSIQYLNKLYDIHIVTKIMDGSPICYVEKIQWIELYLPFLAEKVTATGNKHLFFADIFIDDRPAFQSSWKKQWPTSLVGSLDYPWIDRSKLDIVGYDWSDLEKKLVTLA